MVLINIGYQHWIIKFQDFPRLYHEKNVIYKALISTKIIHSMLNFNVMNNAQSCIKDYTIIMPTIQNLKRESIL